MGFEIQYGHLGSIHPDIEENVPVKKEQALGLSGTTGTWTPHLHVEFRAFNDSGSVDANESAPHKVNLIDLPLIAAAAQQIRGSMNFACILPADNPDVPDIDFNRFSHLPTLLLSVRSAFPNNPLVPVYPVRPSNYVGTVSQNHTLFLPEEKICCYVILREDQIDGYRFYEIQRTDAQRALVPQKRNVEDMGRNDVIAVQVEDASTPPLPARTVVRTRQGLIEAYTSPSIANNVLGHLARDNGYVIWGTYLDLYRYGTFTRAFSGRESLVADGSVSPPRVWPGQARRERLSPAV